MLRWLFGKAKDQASRGDDHVWTTAAARTRGMVRAVASAAAEGASVVVVVANRSALDELAAALAMQRPATCADPGGKAALRDDLGRPGAVTVALAGSLPSDAAPAAGRVEILVVGRGDRAAADDAILAFADGLGPRARVTFHLTFEDPLLRTLGAEIPRVLGKLGATDDEPIVHGFVSRAIAHARAKQTS